LNLHEQVAGGWRRLLNEGVHKVYTSPNIIKVITSRGTRWAGHVACIIKMKN